MKTRRAFLGTVAAGGGAAAVSGQDKVPTPTAKAEAKPAAAVLPAFTYPRKFTGRQLAMLAFPLGGVAAGSISLGGRGQFRDWEIFNRADKGAAPEYAFASIWARSGAGKPVARVLESRILPPYEGSSGLGSKNVPGLHRLDGATFTGEFPIANLAFHDRALPVNVTLEAFTPFIPLDADDSGLPVAILRYRVRNPRKQPASVSIAFAIDNPVGMSNGRNVEIQRHNEPREGSGLSGLVMSNPGMADKHPQWGTFALSALASDGKFTQLRGWPKAKWWASPQLYWDDFTADGQLGPEAEAYNTVGAICLNREIAPGAEADYTFLLSWHFPNRTPAWCGWSAPKGDENTIIGNHYCTRFADAWAAAEYAASHLKDLESRTRAFTRAMRETTLPPAVKDAAMSNLSTLVTQTSFRTADGVFRGFEGLDDHRGCCTGSCTHVWNYEAATQYLFPSLSRSMREAAFRLSDSMQGAMPIRLLVPEGKQQSGTVAADGQMGQIIKAYLDWQLCGDPAWLRKMWPSVKRAIEFSWIPGGWDADRDGVMEGVQHNTYDVEFYGPNPMCGVYYLGALRAAEEMARAAGDTGSADEYRRLFTSGSKWIDAKLFNGEYYIQKVQGIPAAKTAEALRSRGGAEDPEHPDFQLGDGCLVDQLVGQYLADVAGLGALTDPAKIRITLASIYKYNYKHPMLDHESTQRIFALNDESALVVCDYGRGQRPRIPFPYFAEVFTGLEYQAAAHMLYAGMTREGVECVESIRRRYDGERRNPWDEAECGHHYARAMAAWSCLLAMSGFRYFGAEKRVVIKPRGTAKFTSFWSTGTAWGGYTRGPEGITLSVIEGALPCRSAHLGAAAASVKLGNHAVRHQVRKTAGETIVEFADEIVVRPGEALRISI